MAADGSLIFDTKIDTQGFKQGTNTIKSQADGLKSTLVSLGKTIGVVFGVRQLIKFGNQAISAASDLEEVQNVVDVAFGEMSNKMEQFADTAIESFGISKLAAKQTGSTLMAMAKGMGLNTSEASDMAIALTGLSADMASFYNVGQDVASTALKSVFTGETETLKQYGIVMTEVNLQEFAYSQGIKKKVSAMSQAEKVQLRYAYVMEQTALAQGDFARTSDSWANQTRILSEQWKEFLGILGKGLVQVLMPIVKGLNTALSYLITFANAVGEAFSKVFGLKKVITETNGSIKDTGGSVSDLGKDVKQTAKEIQRSLSSFDELNVLSQNIASNTDSIEVGSFNPDKINVGEIISITEPKEASGLTKFLEDFAKTISKVKDAVEPFAKSVGKGFTDFMGTMIDVFKPIVATVADAFGEALGFIGDIIKNTPAETAEALGGAIGGIVTTLLLFLGAKLVGGIIAGIGTALAGLLAAVAAHPLIALTAALAGFIGAVSTMKDIDASDDIVAYARSLDELQASANSASTDLNSYVENLKDRRIGIEAEHAAIDDLVDKYFDLANRIGTLSSEDQALLRAYSEELIKKIPELDKYIDVHTGKYKGTRTEIENLIQKTKEYQLVQAAQESLIEIAKRQYTAGMNLNTVKAEQLKLDTLIKDAEYRLKEATEARGRASTADAVTMQILHQKCLQAKEDLKALKTEYNDNELAITELEKAMSNADVQYQYSIDYIKTHSGELKESQESIKKNTDDFINELSKTMPSGAESIMRKFNSNVESGLSRMQNLFSEKLKELRKSIDSEPPMSLGSYTFTNSTKSSVPGGTSTFNPPRLATGTVVPANYGNFLAILGDNKREPEIVAPESAIEGAVERVITRMGGVGGQEIIINVDGDMAGLVRYMKPYIDKENNRVGVKLVQGGGF